MAATTILGSGNTKSSDLMDNDNGDYNEDDDEYGDEDDDGFEYLDRRTGRPLGNNE